MSKIRDVIIFGEDAMSNKIGELLTRAQATVSVIAMEKLSSAQLEKADCIIENIDRDLAVKKDFFRACKSAKQNTIFATTAMWGITDIASATEKPENFVGLNFLQNDNTGDWVVQISNGLETSPGSAQLCRELVERAGATPVELLDSPGLVLYRPIVAAINEGAIMNMTGIASIEDMDEAVKIRRRWTKGLFEIADEMGIDAVVAILEVMAADMGDQYRPCLLLKKMVAAGRLGKKAGRGFYMYPGD